MANLLENIKVSNRECDKHGSYGSKRPVFNGREIGAWSPCPRCSEEKRAATEQIERSKRYHEKVGEMQSKLSRSGIPKRFRDKTLKGYSLSGCEKQKAVYEQCKHYAQNIHKAISDGVCLLMHGGTGTGKNHLAMAIANYAIKKGFTAHYDKIDLMISDVRHAMRGSDRSERSAIDAYTLPDLLVIDEIGEQSCTEYELRTQNTIIDNRYAECKPTILLSNLPWRTDGERDLYSVLGSRIRSRFAENDGKALLFDWADQRSTIKSDFWSNN